MILDKLSDIDRKDLIQYGKIAGLLLIIIVCLVTSLIIILNSKNVKVELRVGDSYDITGVIPDEDIDFDDTDGKLEYTINGKDEKTGVTDFTIKASEPGKVTLKVKDENGKSYKYKIRITKTSD